MLALKRQLQSDAQSKWCSHSGFAYRTWDLVFWYVSLSVHLFPCCFAKWTITGCPWFTEIVFKWVKIRVSAETKDSSCGNPANIN
jgi:hypothetical protein